MHARRRGLLSSFACGWDAVQAGVRDIREAGKGKKTSQVLCSAETHQNREGLWNAKSRHF